MSPMSPRLLRPRASGLTDPRTVPGLALWLDANASSTITLNGSTVSEWRDRSGNSRHASQTTAARQPQYSASNLNGRPSVIFGSGGITLLDTTAFTTSQPATYFCVIRKDSTASGNLTDTQGGGTGSRQAIFGGAAVQLFADAGVANTGISYTLAPQILTVRFDGSSSFARSGGTQSANVNPGAGVAPNLRIGAFTTSSFGFVGAVSEMLVYGNLTTSQILSVERYLRTKWGIA